MSEWLSGPICAVDVGTSYIKAAVYDGATCLSLERARFPRRTVGERSEADGSELWSVFASTTARAVAGSQCSPVALVLASQMAGLVMLDVEGETIGPIVLGLDTRGADSVSYYPRTGCPPDRVYPVNKLLRMAEEEPGKVDEAALVGGVKEYLIHRLTGGWATDPSSASATAMFDVIEGRWLVEAVNMAGVSLEALPVVSPSTDVAGRIKADAARDCSLDDGTTVLVGIGDGPATNLAAGVCGPGRLCVSVGTTVVLRMMTQEPDPVALIAQSSIPPFVQRVRDRWFAHGLRFDPIDDSFDRYVALGDESKTPIPRTELLAFAKPWIEEREVTEVRLIGRLDEIREVGDELSERWGLDGVHRGADATLGVAMLSNLGPNWSPSSVDEFLASTEVPQPRRAAR